MIIFFDFDRLLQFFSMKNNQYYHRKKCGTKIKVFKNILSTTEKVFFWKSDGKSQVITIGISWANPLALGESVDCWPPVECVVSGTINSLIDKKSYSPIPTFIWLSILNFWRPQIKTQFAIRCRHHVALFVFETLNKH